MTRRCLWPLGVVFLLFLQGGVAWAQDVKPPEVVGLRVGFDGYYRVGLWTPVTVTFRGGSHPVTGWVSLTVPDGDGVPSQVRTPPERLVQLLPGRETSVMLHARAGRVDPTWTVAFHVDDKVVLKKRLDVAYEPDETHPRLALPASQRLIVVVGSGAMGVAEAAALEQEVSGRETVVARLEDVGQLPTRWYGYEGVDTLVLSTSQPQLYRKLSGENARIEALDQWVRMGGRLMLCVGAEADEILHEGGPLARFAPGRLEKVVPLRQTGALESYCDGTKPVPVSFGGRQTPLSAPQLADVEGAVVLAEGRLPLVIQAARSFGRVTFVAMDLDKSPLARWKDRPLFVAKLLGVRPATSDEAKTGKAVMHHGYDDVAGQLRGALDQFTDVRLVPFWLVVLLIVVYIILIGPGDYFLVRKVFRRMEATWITFPLIVVGVSVGAYFLAYRLKGDQTRLNQVDLVDVDTVGSVVRGTSWANLFSPRMEAYDLAFRPRFRAAETQEGDSEITSWFGLPGSALGGMNPRTANPTLWRRHYTFAPDLGAMRGVPIQVWSTKSVTGRWSARGKVGLASELKNEGQIPTGTITNTLDFPLADCVLAFDRWAYDLGTLEPGETVEVGSMLKRSELATLLNERRLVSDEVKDKYHYEATPYDQSSTEVSYILRIMMFFKAGNGENYTGLMDRYQAFVDMSDLLETGRAILFTQGASPRPGAELVCDGQPMAGPRDQHRTFYRFVLPVHPADESR